MNNPVIYYRSSLISNEELSCARKYFKCYDLIAKIPKNSFVIPRYSMWPFFSDQEKELHSKGCKVINSCLENSYVSDLRNFVFDLKELTPKTWENVSDLPEGYSFVLKGETNSLKTNWSKFMFASNKKEVSEIQSRLFNDSLIGNQKIYIREYVPLVNLGTSIGGIPISKEFRLFVFNGKILSTGFYWQNFVEESSIPNSSEIPEKFVDLVLARIGKSISFFSLDIAQTKSGHWIVIELNDGMQSGLCGNDPDVLYRHLAVQTGHIPPSK